MLKSNFVFFVITLLISFTFSCITLAKPPDGLVFFVAFDEGSGDTVKDSSGFGNHGVINGKADWIKGKFGGGFHFDGKTSISVPNKEPLTSLTHPMSVSAWVNPDALGGWQNIVEMDRTAADKTKGWKFGFNVDKVVWTTYGVKDFTGITTISNGKWTHVAATWDGSQAIIYVNGEAEPPIAGGGVIDVKDTKDIPSLDLGWRRSSAASYYSGGMDEVCVFKRVLKEVEIKNLMNGVASMMAVEPNGKLTTKWGDIKNIK
ncbi:MAG: LamG domain-containing protein [Candidatus Poribacteria bacterium]